MPATASYSPLLDNLIDALSYLPGIGPRSATRMAFYLLEAKHRGAGKHLATILNQALTNIDRCSQCRTYTEQSLCKICANPGRDRQLLCIVENPVDILAIEQTQTFRGLYYVLMGHLSPLDGIGPEELELEQLFHYITKQSFQEIILATNPTVEGEATAHYIFQQLKQQHITITRIAHGVPMGSELEYIDSNTLMHALREREPLLA